MFKKKESFGFILIFLSLIFLYREVFLQGKIIFPSNFLAQSYSPWSTAKFQGWEAGIPHKPIGGNDQIRFFYPGRAFTNESIKDGVLPLWNPYILSGTPHLADFQTALFYPLNFLYLFLPQITTWSMLVFIQPLLAMLFTYMYLRLFSIEKIAAFFGSFAFGFSGFMTVWGQENAVVTQAALWLPLVLFGIEGFLKTNGRRYFLIALFALASSFLAGFFQATFYIFTTAFAYALFRVYTIKSKNRLRPTILLIFLFLLALALCGIQLIPSIEGFFQSPRNTSSAWYLFATYLLPVTHVIKALIPDIFGNPGAYNFFGDGFYHEAILYVGIVPLFFALFAMFRLRSYGIISFFSALAAISLFLTLNSPFTQWFYQLPIPLLPTFLPSRILFLTTFSLAILSAFGLSAWIKQDPKKGEKIILLICVTFGAILLFVILFGLVSFFYPTPLLQPFNDYFIKPGGFLTKSHILVMLKNTVLPIGSLFSLLLLVKMNKRRSLSLIGILLLTSFGQFYFLNKYLVLGYPQFLYPKHTVFSFLQENASSYYRFLTFEQPILGNIATYEHIYSPEGLDPIFPNSYGQVLFAAKHDGQVTNDIPRIEATISDLGDKERLSDNTRRLRLLALLGVKYILYFDDHTSPFTRQERFPNDLFLPIWNSTNWYAFEYRNVLPRTFLVDDIRIEKDRQKILDLVFDEKFDLSKSIILEEEPSGFISSHIGSGESAATIKTYKPQEIDITTKTNRTRMLFLSDNYYPGWKAFVDNLEVPIYRADYTFRAVVVPMGTHTIRFVYKPQSLEVGFFVSFFSTGILLLIMFFWPIIFSRKSSR